MPADRECLKALKLETMPLPLFLKIAFWVLKTVFPAGFKIAVGICLKALVLPACEEYSNAHDMLDIWKEKKIFVEKGVIW